MSRIVRFPSRPGRSAASVLLLVLFGLSAACGGRDHLERPEGSALWLGEEAAIDVPTLGRLDRVGLEDLFLEAATLAWVDPSTPRLRPAELPRIPGRRAVTLAVSGRWIGDEAGGGRETVLVAEALAGALDRLKDAAQAAGFVPVGFHLDLRTEEDLEGYGEILGALGERLDTGLFLSATLDPESLTAPGAEAVAEAVDFLVTFAYGRRPADPAWRTAETLEAAVEALEELGRPYLVGLSTVGHLVRASGGAELARSTRGSVGQLLGSRSLELEESFRLDGIDRQTYSFETRRPLRYGEWDLAAGETLTVERLATHQIRRTVRDLERRESKLRRGLLFYRAPGAGEALSLSLVRLEAALAEEPPPPPDLVLKVEDLGRGSLRVTLTNRGEEPTDVARLATNYVEMRVPDGRVGQVDPGEFTRWQLLRPGRDGKLERTFRGASVLRLFAPYVGPGDTVVSGTIRYEGADPRWAGEFLAPDGRTAVPRLPLD